MTKMMKTLLLMVCSFCLSAVAFAQDKNSVDEVMRGNGKIYVVVTCCIIILIGLFLYVFSVDRKIGKIEKGN